MRNLKLFIIIFLTVLAYLSIANLTAEESKEIINTSGASKIKKNQVRTFRDRDGKLLDEIIVPSIPLEQRIPGPIAIPTRSSVILSNVPAFSWSYGCSATSAAMLAGYYDRLNYPNIYTGSTNSGVTPLDNSAWGPSSFNPNDGECPLSATHLGIDGLASSGHVDRYYVALNDSLNDPFGTSDPIGTYSDCTADYMGTNQDWWHNKDGSTSFYNNPDGTPLNNYSTCETASPRKRDGCHGMRLFFESRGYAVSSNYNQYISGYDGNTVGFTIDQYKNMIDAGTPVLIQLDGHTMLGVGYESTNNTIYVYNTWDYNLHTMTWGGSYSGMAHEGVSVLQLVPVYSPGSIVSAEYYIDVDPGEGLGISLGENLNANNATVSKSNISTSNLSLGCHWVYVRFKDANGWGQPKASLLTVGNPISKTMQAAEYYIDTYPGQNHGTLACPTGSTMSVATLSAINTSGLSLGTHFLYIRFKDSSDQWGNTQASMLTISNPASKSIAAAEYYIDTDPGQGSGRRLTGTFTGTNAAVALQNIDTHELAYGVHWVYVRFKDSMHQWGSSEASLLTIGNPNSNIISAAEYFIDDDPGIGQAHPMSGNFGSQNALTSVPFAATLGLTDGLHKVNVRMKDSNNQWGNLISKELVVGNAINWVDEFSVFNSSNYYTSGTAVYNSTSHDVTLTTPVNWISGRIYNTHQFYMNEFIAEYDFKIGGGTGADGIMFGWVPSYNYPTSNGGLLDFNTTNGYGVEFDVFTNSGDISEEAIGLVYNQASNHLKQTTMLNNSIENNVWHHAKITFDMGHVIVFMDNTQYLEYWISDYAPFNGYFGLSGATGTQNHLQLIDNVNVRQSDYLQPISIAGLINVYQGMGIGGITLTASGTASIETTNSDGTYQIYVPRGWSGTITASQSGWAFSPAVHSYTNIQINQIQQNFTASPTSAPGFGVIYGYIRNSSNNIPIMRATVSTTNNHYALQPTDVNGFFRIDGVPYGNGYHLYCSAQGYMNYNLSPINLTLSNSPYQVTVLMTSNVLQAVYEISPFIPSVNTKASRIGKNGTLHRYYKILDPSLNMPGSNEQITVTSSSFSRSYTANSEGIVDITISSSEIGSGQAGNSQVFQISKLNQQSLVEPIEFTCIVEDFILEKDWKTENYFKTSTSSFVSLWGELNSGLFTRIYDKDGVLDNVDDIYLTRQLKAGFGAEFGFGSPYYIKMGNIQVGHDLNLSSSVGFTGITEDNFTFPHHVDTFASSLGKYLTLCSGSYSCLDQPLIRLLGSIEVALLDYSALEDASTGDSKGIGVKTATDVNVGIGTVNLTSAIPYDVKANADLGFEGNVVLKIENHIGTNELEYVLDASSETNLQAGAGVTLLIPNSAEYLRELNNNLNLIDTNGRIEVSFSIFKNKQSMQWTRCVIKRVSRSGSSTNGNESTMEYTMKGNELQNILDSSNDIIHTLGNDLQGIHNLIIHNNSHAQIIEDVFTACNNAQNQDRDITVEFTISQAKVTTYAPFEAKVSWIHLQYGGNIPQEERVTKEVSRGNWYKGKHYITSGYQQTNSTSPITFKQIFEKTVSDLPTVVKASIGVQNVFRKRSALRQNFYIGNNGSFINFTPNSISSDTDSVFCTSWSWYGNSPAKLPSEVTSRQKAIYDKYRTMSEEMAGMKYGIGGFYQLEPYAMDLLEPCEFTICYPENDIAGLNESSLAMYMEDKDNNTWIYIGGFLDTINNTITVPISKLGLYTLAPRSPLGSFNIFADPDSIEADGISIIHLFTSDIHNNDGSVLANGEFMTVSADAGEITSEDADLTTAGFQVAVQNGRIDFDLKASTTAQIALVSVTSTMGQASGMIYVKFFDQRPPSAPTQLTLIAGEDNLSLTWQKNTDPDVSGYVVYYDSDQAGSPYYGTATVLGLPSPILVQDTCYVISGLTSDVLYYVAIKAYDSSGNLSGYSSEVSGTPSSMISNVENIAMSLYGNHVKLQWPAINHAQSYKIYSSDSPSGVYELRIHTSQMNWLDPVEGTRRFYMIKASSESISKGGITGNSKTRK